MAANFGYVKIKTDRKDASVYVDGGFADKVEKAKKFALRPVRQGSSAEPKFPSCRQIGSKRREGQFIGACLMKLPPTGRLARVVESMSAGITSP
jgi:hypothetical protein